MSYVDAIHSRENDQIKVVERINGKRVFTNHPAKYVLYYSEPRGGYKSIFGDVVEKFSTTSWKAFQKEIYSLNNKKDIKVFESDVNPIFRCLSENYIDAPEPEMHLAFLDIEVDYDPEKGFSSPDDAFSPITAISLHLNWVDSIITLALRPPTVSQEDAERICKTFDNCFLCNTEKELLELFLKFIDDADILSGWNSTGFDIPYIHNRIIKVLGKDYLRMLCLWDQLPRKRTYIQYKTERITYDLVGRVHMDYLDLYRKHTYSERLSYRLDFIAEQEIGEKKTAYEGTLDSLYKNDFRKFIEYNRQDVMLLVKMDNKLKFIALSNQLAHTNTVLLKTTLGSVALIEQAIINEAHSRNMVVPNRKSDKEEEESDTDDDEDDEDEYEGKGSAAGAYVADPKVGLHEWIGGVDINSLYPSTIRAFNMGPETLIGQIRQTDTLKFLHDRMAKMKKPSMTKAWEGVFNALEYDTVMNKEEKELILDLEGGESFPISGKDLYEFIFESGNPYTLSANGTLFRTDIEGVIPGLLARWYSERKDMQQKAKDCEKLINGVEIKDTSFLRKLESKI
jgi:DNA polymerase elongation subunit (family B)